MNRSRILQIVCADPGLARRYLRELERGGNVCELALALSATEALRCMGSDAPLVTLLDDSAVAPGEPLEACAAVLCGIAPLVVVASPEREAELDGFIRSGWADFVPRNGEYIPVAAGLVERRMRGDGQGPGTEVHGAERQACEDFGELLRHEVNNPLTGILGNAELLLARREQLPSVVVERLETIAELAVRLRETVRRLSDAWQERREHVPSSQEAASG